MALEEKHRMVEDVHLGEVVEERDLPRPSGVMNQHQCGVLLLFEFLNM